VYSVSLCVCDGRTRAAAMASAVLSATLCVSHSLFFFSGLACRSCVRKLLRSHQVFFRLHVRFVTTVTRLLSPKARMYAAAVFPTAGVHSTTLHTAALYFSSSKPAVPAVRLHFGCRYAILSTQLCARCVCGVSCRRSAASMSVLVQLSPSTLNRRRG